MATEHHFYLDTPDSRHAIRAALVWAKVGLEALPDWEHVSQVASEATNVSIVELDDPALGAGRTLRPDNGVFATRSLCFRHRRAVPSSTFQKQTLLGVMALLKAFPQADAFWEAYDGRHPILLRRDGRLILAEEETTNGNEWDAERQPYLALVDLRYTIEPLGPWVDVPIETRAVPR